MVLRHLCLVLSYCSLCISSISHADDTEALAKASQNPVADMISVPLQNNTNFNLGDYDRTQNILNIQPVIPTHLTTNYNLISRIILPVIDQPLINRPSGSKFGIGDLNPTFFLAPSKPEKLIWGLGPVFVLPTATDRLLGQGKWSAGPSVVFVLMPGNWVIGVLANNVWSFAGNSNRPNVNQFLMQYFINYNMPKGWYLTSAPIITADWTAQRDSRWVVPFGLGGGRVFKIAGQAINAGMSAYYNVERPHIGPDWQFRAQITFLFPTA